MITKRILEEFKKVFYERNINSDIEILEFIGQKHILINTKYGLCKIDKWSVLNNTNVTIKAAINKTKYFINQAKETHNSKYDYSLVEYVNSQIKVKIICPIHGQFLQSPINHLSGCGCIKCTNCELSNTKDFVNKARKVHGDKYDYSLVEYKNAKEKVKIICKEHGIFEQSPNKHLQKRGCKLCAINYRANKKTYTFKEFVKKSNITHNNKYTYNETNYENGSSIIEILCPIHGIFKQRSSFHLNKNGCGECARQKMIIFNEINPVGWNKINWFKAARKSKKYDSFKVYIIKCWNDEEEFYKIGRTFREVNKRFKYKKEMPYNYEIIQTFEFKELTQENCIKAYDLEVSLKKENRENKYIPLKKFAGMHECFKTLK